MSWEENTRGGAPDEDEAGVPEFLLDPVGVGRRRLVPMLICFVLGLIVTAGVTTVLDPIYQSTATVLITSQQIPEDFVRSTVRENTLANLNAMIGAVLSAENLSQLIDQYELFPQAADRARIDLVGEMRSRILAEPRGGYSRHSSSMVYEISYESEDPYESAKVANALAAFFVEASISRRNVQARRTTTFLRRELERDEKELREHSATISEFRRIHRGGLPSELDTNLRKLDILAARRESLSQKIENKEIRIQEMTNAGGGFTGDDGEALLFELQRELVRQEAVNTDEHPNVVSLRERIARLEQTLQTSGPSTRTQRALNAEYRDIERLRKQIQEIGVEMASLNRRIDQTPRVGEELSALTQKEQVLREDYLDALRKVEEAELAEILESAQQGGQVSLLDVAQPPSSPTRPRSMVAAAGLALSLAAAVGLAMLLELVDPVVVGARQIERMSDQPVIGTLPHIA